MGVKDLRLVNLVLLSKWRSRFCRASLVFGQTFYMSGMLLLLCTLGVEVDLWGTTLVLPGEEE